MIYALTLLQLVVIIFLAFELHTARIENGMLAKRAAQATELYEDASKLYATLVNKTW